MSGTAARSPSAAPGRPHRRGPRRPGSGAGRRAAGAPRRSPRRSARPPGWPRGRSRTGPRPGSFCTSARATSGSIARRRAGSSRPSRQPVPRPAGVDPAPPTAPGATAASRIAVGVGNALRRMPASSKVAPSASPMRLRRAFAWSPDRWPARMAHAAASYGE